MQCLRFDERTDMNGVKWWALGKLGSVALRPNSDEYETFSWLIRGTNPLGKFKSLRRAKDKIRKLMSGDK